MDMTITNIPQTAIQKTAIQKPAQRISNQISASPSQTTQEEASQTDKRGKEVANKVANKGKKVGSEANLDIKDFCVIS